MTTAPEMYADIRNRLLERASTLDESQREAPVPALPLWTVRDTYAHLAGVVADTLTGNLDDLGTPQWTAKHVADRADRTLDEICAEWAGNAERFDAEMRAHKALWGNTFDLWHHEQDIRAALGQPVDRAETRVRFALDALVPAATSFWPPETPAIRLVADDIDNEWQLGHGTPTTTIRASGYELARTIAGRRSRAQMEALGWDNPVPHLANMPAFGFADKALAE